MTRLFISLQIFLPHRLLSFFMFLLTRVRLRPFKNLFITNFIKIYNVDMQLAKTEEPTAYEHFNSFFTRELKVEARPIISGNNYFACPVDGTVSQQGRITEGRLYQAKGRDYSLTNLLGSSNELAMRFKHGSFATLYLSPRDYHRIHMPVRGKLRETLYVPGRLFSVSDVSARHIPNLFARNERLITIYDTEFGSMAMILVGALFVSGIETVWSGQARPSLISRQRNKIKHTNFSQTDSEAPTLEKGEEMGRFNMGSTVIMLFANNQITLTDEIIAGASIKMGQHLASI